MGQFLVERATLAPPCSDNALEALLVAVHDAGFRDGRCGERALDELRNFAVVDAMLKIHVYDPDVALADAPSGDRLKIIARETLRGHDTSCHLSAESYVQPVVTGGAMLMAAQEAQALEDAPGMLEEILDDRVLDATGSIEVETGAVLVWRTTRVCARTS